ncbi:enoyl-CoA hydratase/isomerase family protein [Zhongshania sp.]|uniref:enoyl-CoA hydratase/isomerase family protein n=1 Tax=Zhongshania sp. TaxID=1971902 RepID=UPI00356B284A
MTLPDCQELLLKLEDGVLHITLNRPHKRNAMNSRLVDEMMAVFTAIEKERGVRAVVLRGAEGNFCAGGDISGMNDRKTDIDGQPINAEQAAWNFNRSFGHMITKVNHAPQVVICVLEGAVLGGGFGLACISDIAIADVGATLAMPETGLGIIPAQIAPFVVMRVGLTQARRLALTGERIKGDAAQEMGLVHFVTKGEEALSTQLASVITGVKRCAPEANAQTKELMLQVGKGDLENLLDKASDMFSVALRGPEGQEGTRAFIEKRKPNWSVK